MSEPIATSGSPYNTQIPQLSENADIQTALRYYHYGVDTNETTLGALNPNSMAGHLYALETSKIGKTPSVIPDSANLNDYDETGYYHQANSDWANNGTGYPRINSLSYSGMLKVVAIGGAIYQQYHMSGAPTANTVIFYRAKLASASWPASWTQYVSTSDLNTSLANYYTKTESNSRHLVLGESTTKSDISSSPTAGDLLMFNGTKWVNTRKGYALEDTIIVTGITQVPPVVNPTYTFAKADYPWLRAIKIKAVGGGGAGATATSDLSVAGGGAGAYVEKFITDISALPAEVEYAVGYGGVSYDPVNAIALETVLDGGDSYFGTYAKALGGATPTINNRVGGNGGARGSSIGDLKVDGGDGGSGYGGNNGISGHGGASFFGGGAKARANGEGNGYASNVYGAGGSGAVRNNGTKAGGNGAPGVVIIELYA